MEENKKALQEKSSPLVALTESPESAVKIMDSIKNNFSTLIKKNNEILEIPTKQGKKQYIKYEGWLTISTILGIFPQIVEITPINKGFMAKAIAVNIKNGQTVGSAYGICSKDEPLWATRPEFSLAAMAQTRAAARCLKSILGGVITHLGYEGSPAEIAEEDDAPEAPAAPGAPAAPAANNTNPASDKQIKCIYAISKKVGMEEAELKEWIKNEFGKDSTKDLTVSEASKTIEHLQQ